MFRNDDAAPVKITFTGYSDSGDLAPYITGKICGQEPVGATTYCPANLLWPASNELIVPPGQTSPEFALLLGMPEYITGGRGLTGSFLFTWNVERAVVTATNDTQITEHDTAATINVLQNDGLTTGLAYTVAVSNGTNGTWVVNPNNTVTFTPTAGFSGDATATYTVTGPLGEFATATITVTVNPAPLVPPAPVNDTATTENNTPVAINVLGNDALTSGVTYTVTVAGDTNGTWTVNPDNTVTFAPAAGFTGDATAQYTITGSDGQTATAGITVTVNPPKVVPKPVATDDSASTAFNTAVNVNVLGNDTLTSGVTYTVAVAGGTNGTWTVNADNTVSFTPTAGFTGTATAKYTITGSDGQTATANISVTVGAAPAAPTPVPTLGSLAMALLGLCLAGFGARRIQQKRG